MWSFSSQHYPIFTANITAENVYQTPTNKRKARFIICKVSQLFFLSSRHLNCHTTFAVIVLLSIESVSGFKTIQIGGVQTVFQIL